MLPHQTVLPNGLVPFAAEYTGSLSELEELRSTCRRQARVIARLTSVVSGLRRGRTVLKTEAVELRAENCRIRDAAERVEVRLPLDAQAPGAARIVAAQYLRDRVTAPVLDAAMLVISELATNSVRHSHAPAADGVMVRLQLTRAMLRLEVEDSGHEGAIAARPPDQQTGSGCGLNIVRALSDRWGVERSAQLGTRVWAQLARTPITAAPS